MIIQSKKIWIADQFLAAQVEMDGGKITEVGTHAELVKNKGVYYRLMMKQAEALKTKGIS